MNKDEKPKVAARELVTKLKDEKGITFKYISEEDAALYFRERNNYMRTASYRKNYLKYEAGVNKGKYIYLDFAYLQELSIIDMHLRYIINKMCLDIEHDLKVQLLKDIEDDTNMDGYDIVAQFLEKYQYVINNLEATTSSPFTNDLLVKYFTIGQNVNRSTGKMYYKIVEYDDCPVWVLLELVSFGDFIKFYQFYYDKTDKKGIPVSLINLTKSLRNASAHNNCILADLTKGSSHIPPIVSQEVAKLKGITKSQRKKNLSGRTVLELVAMLILYKKVVSEKVMFHRIKEFKQFLNGRMIEKKAFFKDNFLLRNTYEFIYKCTYELFP